MAQEALDKVTREPVPDADGRVLGAGDDVFIVEADVEDAGLVACEAAEGFVVILDVPDYAGVVRGAGDEDLVVELEAENRGAVVVVCCGGGDN